MRESLNSWKSCFFPLENASAIKHIINLNQCRTDLKAIKYPPAKGRGYLFCGQPLILLKKERGAILRIPASIYPFTKDLLPIVRHFTELQDTYSLNQVITWKGTGLSGKDAAFAYNHPQINVMVKDISSLNRDWDVLLIDCSKLGNANSAVDEFEFLNTCLQDHKKVVFINNGGNMPLYFGKLKSRYRSSVETFNIQEKVAGYSYFVNSEYSPLSVPVLLVGGLIDSSDSLEVILALKKEFAIKGYTTSCFSDNNIASLLGVHSVAHIWNNSSLTENGKILQLNQFIRSIVNIESPQLILAEAPDAIIKYNDVVPNGFGIRTFMLCQAILPDYFIASVTCDLAVNDFLESVSSGIQGKYGFPVSAVQVSNTIVDSSSLVYDGAPLCVHTDMSVVTKVLQKGLKRTIPIYDVISQGATELFQYVCQLVQGGN